jgi:hypothetical protein
MSRFAIKTAQRHAGAVDREIAVERKADVLNEGIDAKMKGLGGLATFRDMIKSAIKLRQILDFDH